MRKRHLLLQVAFVALLAGGLLLLTRGRQPRDLALQIDLTAALPGDIAELDVIVRRDGHTISRHDVQYGKEGAPATVELPVHAQPGAAEVETTLVYAGKPAHKSVTQVDLSEAAPARVMAR